MYEHRLILNRYFPSYPIDRTDWKCPQIIKRYLLTKLNGAYIYWVSVPNSVIRRIYLELKTRPLTVARFVAGMREKWESFHSSPAWAECRELLNSLLETFLLSPFRRLLSHFIEDSQRYRWIDTKDTIDTIASIYNRYIQYRIDIPMNL